MGILTDSTDTSHPIHHQKGPTAVVYNLYCSHGKPKAWFIASWPDTQRLPATLWGHDRPQCYKLSRPPGPVKATKSSLERGIGMVSCSQVSTKATPVHQLRDDVVSGGSAMAAQAGLEWFQRLVIGPSLDGSTAEASAETPRMSAGRDRMAMYTPCVAPVRVGRYVVTRTSRFACSVLCGAPRNSHLAHPIAGQRPGWPQPISNRQPVRWLPGCLTAGRKVHWPSRPNPRSVRRIGAYYSTQSRLGLPRLN